MSVGHNLDPELKSRRLMIVKRDDTVYDKDERKVDMSDIKRPLSSVVDATPVFFTGSNLSIVNGCWTKQGL